MATPIPVRRLSKAATVEIDGQTYELRLSLAAILDFEQESGKHFLQFIKPVFEVARAMGRSGDLDLANVEAAGWDALTQLIDQDAITGKEIATLFWACAGGSDSGMSVRDAAKLVHLGNVREVFAAMFKSVSDTLPDSQGDGGGSDPNPTA